MIPSIYTPPLGFGNGHVQTVFPSLFRTVPQVTYTRERIDTPDQDFLDLDWSRIGARRLVVISHGLEGDSHRAYVKGMVRAVNQEGWDALAWNYRGCSQEPNRSLRFYHNGATDDLNRVITHAAETGKYREIALVGFSLGGNLTLVHLGRDEVHPLVSRAVVFSVPCDLTAASRQLTLPANRIYMKRFLVLLHGKIKAKAAQFPDRIDDAGYGAIKTFREFDDRYTAPIHGFKDAQDYWDQCASLQYIPTIHHPCLVVNALNDPFLPRECYPVEAAKKNGCVTLATPRSGGHVGFMAFNGRGRYWSEEVAVDFLSQD